SPAWRDGRYSKLMAGAGLGEAYERARSDPNLLSLRRSIATLDARIEQLGEALAEPAQRASVWGELLGCFEQRRKLTETEAKTRERVYRVLTSSEMVGIMNALVASVTRATCPTATRWRRLGGIFGRCKLGVVGKREMHNQITEATDYLQADAILGRGRFYPPA